MMTSEPYIPSGYRREPEKRWCCRCGADPQYGRGGFWYCLKCWAESGLWKERLTS